MTNIKKIIPFLILISSLAAGGALFARADVQPDISYPVIELGGCRNQAECRAFCDLPENRPGVCWDFAKKHNLVSQDEIKKVDKFIEVSRKGGPGGCKSERECIKYCSSISRIEECLDFAEKNDFVPKAELTEAKKVLSYIKTGGKTPGECGSKEECEEYCGAEGHFNECLDFGEKSGLLSEDEIEIAKKSGGKGPGGCNSRESCEEFCRVKENQDTCISFAEDRGLLSPEELGEIKKFGDLEDLLEKAPEGVSECLNKNVGQEIISKLESGTIVTDPKILSGVRSCFEGVKTEIMGSIKNCLSLSCEESMICLQKLKGDSEEAKATPPEIAREIMEKVNSCMKDETDGLNDKYLEEMPAKIEMFMIEGSEPQFRMDYKPPAGEPYPTDHPGEYKLEDNLVY